MKTSEFNYYLPQELIAQQPANPRDSARLLAYDRKEDKLTHCTFSDIGDFLKPGDLLVVNNTRVIPARMYGKKADKDTVFEILLLKRIDYKNWEAIMRPARRAKVGAVIVISDELTAKVERICDNGVRILHFEFEGVFEEILSRVGNIPLPPYITEKLEDNERYQTVYSKVDGSSAAPTAGLHFTDELISSLKEKGVEFATVLLNIGLGTFRPVKSENILEHKMHAEEFEIDEENAEKINRAKSEGRRVIAVGTTSVRTLESVADDSGHLEAMKGETRIFIYPGYKFKAVDALITNFHLPESTLLMLVSALIGKDKTMEIYNTAVKEKYRFFSFGDCCFFY